jgi:hypothetical protein
VTKFFTNCPKDLLEAFDALPNAASKLLDHACRDLFV